MEQLLAELAACLRERLSIISDEESRREPARHMARLEEVSDALECLERRLPANFDPPLRHYLQRRSYAKALEHIEANTAG